MGKAGNQYTDLASVMKELESCGTEQNVKIYRRHGAVGDLFGVSFANINRIAKAIKKNHPLALQLWDTGNSDAQTLATLIADPSIISSKDLQSWVSDIRFGGVASYFIDKLVIKTPLAKERMGVWIPAEQEYVRLCGYAIAGQLAKNDPDVSDSLFLSLIEKIEREIHDSANRAKEMMNLTLIAIGKRNDVLRASALAAAKRIGKVDVDHGETSCKTPDAVKELSA